MRQRPSAPSSWRRPSSQLTDDLAHISRFVGYFTNPGKLELFGAIDENLQNNFITLKGFHKII